MKLGLPRGCAAQVLMPPTRGHDLKLSTSTMPGTAARMPPTRGHDLKLWTGAVAHQPTGMPPTRGHDLKHSDLYKNDCNF